MSNPMLDLMKYVRLTDQVEERKWVLAKWLSDENASGKSLTQLAEETGRSQAMVGRWVAVHRRYGAHRQKRFDEALYAIRQLRRVDGR